MVGCPGNERGGTWLANVVGTSFPGLRRSGGLTRQRRGCNVVGERGWNLVLRPPAIWWADPAATWWNVVGERGWNLVLRPPAIWWADPAATWWNVVGECGWNLFPFPGDLVG